MIKLERYEVNEASKGHSIFSGQLWSIPVKVLERKKGTTAYKILKFIESFGEEGVRFTDIKKFLIEDIRGIRYNPTTHRGIWNTNFYGPRFGKRKPGLLDYYCEKVPGTKKWRLNPETMAYLATEPEETIKYSLHSKDTVRDIAKRNPNYPQDLEGWAINMDDWT